MALSKILNISLYSEHAVWTNYLANREYLGLNNKTERMLGNINYYAGKVIKYLIISIPFTALAITMFVVYWLVSS